MAALLAIRTGIGARLGLAFAVVVILAAATNFIAERGASIVRTSRVTSAAPPVVTAPPVVQAVQPPPVAEPVVQAAPPPPLPAADPLLAAINQVGRSLQARMSLQSEGLQDEFVAARQELKLRSKRFLDTAQTTSTAAKRRSLATALEQFDNAGASTVAVADARHAAHLSYMQGLDAMQGRLKDTLDRALKLFGRVIARQYLVNLRDQLDELRRRSTALASPNYKPEDVSAIEAAESQFASTLNQNVTRLSGSEGEVWFAQMKLDLTQLETQRTTIQTLDTQRVESLAAFLASMPALEKQIRDMATVRSLAPPAAKPVRVAAAQPAAPLSVAEVLEAEAAPAPAPATVTTVERVEKPAGEGRSVIRGITLAVLVVLLLICVATVRSIVRPVRSLLAATTRIASGERGVRVQRGGIRELDTLAIAFNKMADQVAAAREAAQDHSQSLEQRVDERTKQLQHLAEHDPLTQLPNRRQLFTMLNAALAEAALNKTRLGVFFLDLDNFKHINDGMGHAFGDRLLVAIAERLRAATSSGFAARFGGDEFTVVHTNADSLEEIRTAGWELVRAFQQPLIVDGRELVISVSVGASLYPDHHDTAEALLRAADTALFRAKALGRSQLTVFTPELLEAAASRFSTEQGLRRAVERGEFELVFQPEVHTGTLQAGLVEALLRWRLPDGRYATPGEFLAVAEESGLIMEISDWVLRSAVETTAAWYHGDWPQARVAINVSSRQLLDHRFVDQIMILLEKHDLPARCIEIELTETVLQTSPATVETLRRLHALGVAIALDDFGTGYSSIASLEQLPLSRVKLDRSLIDSIDTSPRSAAIANAIIRLCHDLDLEITAEGIERPEQFAALMSHRPLYLQGYLIARPTPQSELLSTLANLPGQMQSLILSCPPAPVAATPLFEVARKSQTL